MIERHPEARLALGDLAREAGLSRYHFLRTFQQLTGVTPHKYILRTRLREAAIRLAAEPAKVLDTALDCGFADVSNFNRAFRSEFGVTPRLYRQDAPDWLGQSSDLSPDSDRDQNEDERTCRSSPRAPPNRSFFVDEGIDNFSEDRFYPAGAFRKFGVHLQRAVKIHGLAQQIVCAVQPASRQAL